MKVASFTINHDKLDRGVYVSRKDTVGSEVVTTFDIRMKLSNIEPVLGNPELHTLEHLFAVYLRGVCSWADKVLYIGPMGCRTGMYLLMKGDLSPQDILWFLKDMFSFVAEFSEDIPATTSKECGNYLDHNLCFAKHEAKKFLFEVLSDIKESQIVYPD